MLTQIEKQQFRGLLFRHLDGIVMAPAAFALHEKKVLSYLLNNKTVFLKEITEQFNANEGYLNAALRLLCSYGWLVQKIDNENDIIEYGLSDSSEIAFNHVHHYEDVVKLLKYSEQFHQRKFELEPFLALIKIFEKFKNNYGLTISNDEKTQIIQQQILDHIEGHIVGPTTVRLGMSGMFHKYFMEAPFRPEEFHRDVESFGKLLDMFSYLGWFDEKNGTYQFTEKGLFYAKRASAYGVTVSYTPMFRKLDEMIFGDPEILRTRDQLETEIHVDRATNVWGSGGAHAVYFNAIDEIIVKLFNQPIDKQPKGILDMGCGNGAFLQHIFDVIDQQTARGKLLDEYPLFIVGADYNQIALKIAKENLINADIWAKVIFGDVGKPDVLAEKLKKDYDINLIDLLNVRTFLDHNRPWRPPKISNPSRASQSTGAFVYRGKRINNNLIEDSLVEHFLDWAPYIKKFGLLMMELHTLPPLVTAAHIGKTPATAYDGTHSFSDQYIVELDVFLKAASEAELYSDPKFHKKFPDTEFSTVTIHLLKGKSS